jgi:hypothetical protein
LGLIFDGLGWVWVQYFGFGSKNFMGWVFIDNMLFIRSNFDLKK